MKTVLDLNNKEARNFFLKEKSYCSFDLPLYFEFSELINKISKKLKGSNLSDFTNKKSPNHFNDVNYKLLNNKDGKYAWRPLQLIHPGIYVDLTNKITEKKNWKQIKTRLNGFKKYSDVECMSIPVKSQSKQSDKAELVNKWWKKVEQKSIELALDYDYILHTDIANCYGSIYTHTISWSIHGKKISKNNPFDLQHIGNAIDRSLMSMSHGQTNGIPQGSVLMDFIAEIVLHYADLQLTKKIDNQKNDYKIIRYRDDYRIFVNNPQFGKFIVKNLTETLIDLGLKLKDSKTITSKNVIKNSIKPEKLYQIKNNKGYKSPQKELLAIKDFSDQFPNSGTLNKRLDNFYSKFKKRKKWKDSFGSLRASISIITEIAFRNPRTYPISTAIISKFISFSKDRSDQKEIITKIKNKFKKLPNTEHLLLWLQRITIKIDSNINYKKRLCRKVKGENIQIWNSDWLDNGDLKKIINNTRIINKEKIKEITPVINENEVALFNPIIDS